MNSTWIKVALIYVKVILILVQFLFFEIPLILILISFKNAKKILVVQVCLRGNTGHQEIGAIW